MIEIKVNKNEIEKAFKINIASIPVIEVAKLIKNDINRNLIESTLLDGKAPAPLNPYYRNYKLKHWGHDNIFWGKYGLLRNAIVVNKVSEDKSNITINANRYTIAGYIITGKKQPARDFFGISKRVIAEINNYLSNKFKRVA